MDKCRQEFEQLAGAEGIISGFEGTTIDERSGKYLDGNLDFAWIFYQAAWNNRAQTVKQEQEPASRIARRLRIEKLARILSEAEKTVSPILDTRAGNEQDVTGIRMGWGAWALLRAEIISTIEIVCEQDADFAATPPADAQQQPTNELNVIERWKLGGGYNKQAVFDLYDAQQQEIERLQRAWDSSFKQAIKNGARAQELEAQLSAIRKLVDSQRPCIVSDAAIIDEIRVILSAQGGEK